MQLGMIGLGRMGAGMSKRLMRAGHDLVVHDVDPAAVARVVDEGASGALVLADFVAALSPPRAIWLMVPAAFVDATIDALVPCLEAGDILIDGGNSRFHDDLLRAERLDAHGIHYVDVGTSGGVAGHFVKMIHNGIEYGLMAAYAEGLNILRHANVGMREHAADAETTPLEHPEHYRYEMDVAAITELWRRGSVIGSWLLDLTARALQRDPGLSNFSGRVSDSGEGRWTLQAGIDEGVPVLSASLYQ